MNARQLTLGLSALLLVLVLAGSGWLWRELRQNSPESLLSCVDTAAAPLAWTCRKVLEHDSLRPDQVKQLNAEGGALYPLLLKDRAEAEAMLALFIQRGVDINAGNPFADGRCALFTVIDDSDLARVRMLLAQGARVDVADKTGLTPLEFARLLQRQHPQEPDRFAIVAALEAAGRR